MRPRYQCGVCGGEADPEVVALMAIHQYDYWVVHRIELKGGVVQVLVCPNCTTLTQDLILESYKQRIRDGLVEGYH